MPEFNKPISVKQNIDFDGKKLTISLAIEIDIDVLQDLINEGNVDLKKNFKSLNSNNVKDKLDYNDLFQ